MKSIILIFLVTIGLLAMGQNPQEKIEFYNFKVRNQFALGEYSLVIKYYDSILLITNIPNIEAFKAAYTSYEILETTDSMLVGKKEEVKTLAITVLGEALISEEWDRTQPELIFTIVEQMPEYFGGIAQFYEDVNTHLQYPPYAKINGVEGRVYVEFNVEKDGSITATRVVKGIGAGCDEEALRIFGILPKFQPGMQKGNPVKVKMVLPIYFRLSSPPKKNTFPVQRSKF